MSPPASVHSTKHEQPAKPAEPLEKVDEYEDAEKNYQPRSLKFWTIISGVYLSIFLVALVIDISQLWITIQADSKVGPNHHCNSHSKYNRRFRFHPRYRLVWQRLHADLRMLQSHHRPNISALLNKMGILRLNRPFRSGLCTVRCRSQFDRLHYRTCHCWHWRSGNLLRWNNDHHSTRTSSQASGIHLDVWVGIRIVICPWADHGRCFYGAHVSGLRKPGSRLC